MAIALTVLLGVLTVGAALVLADRSHAAIAFATRRIVSRCPGRSGSLHRARVGSWLPAGRGCVRGDPDRRRRHPSPGLDAASWWASWASDCSPFCTGRRGPALADPPTRGSTDTELELTTAGARPLATFAVC